MLAAARAFLGKVLGAESSGGGGEEGEKKGAAPRTAPKNSRDSARNHAPIKAEFIVPMEVRVAARERDAKEEADSARAAGASEKRPASSNRKERRGQNKKRRRDGSSTENARAIEDTRDVICAQMGRTGLCSYGDSCKYTHDVIAYLQSKPPDIGPRCYVWDVRGYCPAGIKCRFGSCHIDRATGANLRRTEDEGGVTDDMDTLNVLKKEVVQSLHKNTFNYACTQRGFKEYLQRLEARDDAVAGGGKPDGSCPQRPAGFFPDRERKSVSFEGKVYVAPLTTVGNLPFRRCMKDLGADITCGEMALGINLLKGQASEWALLKRHRCEDVFGVQIAGAHADQMTRVAELIESQMEVDFVDLNLGCPIDLVCERGMGSALMMRPRKLRGIVHGMTSVLSCPITVKMRVGWDDKKRVAHTLVQSLQRISVSPGSIAAVMVHGRSRLQRYTKLADWDYIRQVGEMQLSNRPRIPLIGNGDILSWQDCEERGLMRPAGGSGGAGGISSCAMIGRGALIKPWLPTEIKEKRDWDISAGERLDIFRNFVNYGLDHWGSDKMGIDFTRRFLLEWMSFTHRYVPAGLLEVLPQRINQMPPPYYGRSDLETLLSSPSVKDWINVSEMLLGPIAPGFSFVPKHKSNSYALRVTTLPTA
jgi:tRNA-dihydrouridine synthase 3